MRTIWISNPRSPSTNDGPRALVLSDGFLRQATTILKRLTLVTLCLHVKRAVHLKQERSMFAILRRSRKHGGQHATRNSGRPSPEVMQVGGDNACPCRRRENSCNVAASMRV